MMIEVSKARKINPALFISWIHNRVYDRRTMRSYPIKNVRVGKANYAYVNKEVIQNEI